MLSRSIPFLYPITTAPQCDQALLQHFQRYFSSTKLKVLMDALYLKSVIKDKILHSEAIAVIAKNDNYILLY